MKAMCVFQNIVSFLKMFFFLSIAENLSDPHHIQTLTESVFRMDGTRRREGSEEVKKRR